MENSFDLLVDKVRIWVNSLRLNSVFQYMGASAVGGDAIIKYNAGAGNHTGEIDFRIKISGNNIFKVSVYINTESELYGNSLLVTEIRQTTLNLQNFLNHNG